MIKKTKLKSNQIDIPISSRLKKKTTVSFILKQVDVLVVRKLRFIFSR